MPLIATDEPLGFVDIGHRPELNASDLPQTRIAKDPEPAPAPLTDAEKRPALMNVALEREGAQGITVGNIPRAETANLVSEALGREALPVVPSRPLPESASVIAAAFRQENLIGSAISSLDFRDRGPIDEKHDPFEVIKGTDLEPFWKQFVSSRNADDTAAISQRIRQEQTDRRTISDAGWRGAAASMAASVLDPTILLPVAAPIKAARVADAAISALKVGASAAAATAVQEAGLQAMQETRPWSESATAVGGAVVLGGILGGAISTLSVREFSSLADRFDRALKVPEASKSDAFGEKVFDDFDRAPPEFKGVGAQAVNADLPPVQLESAFGLEKLLKFLSPTLRGMQSPILATREATVQLAETALALTRNKAGYSTAPDGGAVSTRIKIMGDGPEGDVLMEWEKLYSEYRFGYQNATLAKSRGSISSALGQSKMLTWTEFLEEIGSAWSRGDKHDTIPQIAKAAAFGRAHHLNPRAEDAMKYGLYPEDLFDTSPKAPKSASVNERPAWGSEAHTKRRGIEDMVAEIQRATGMSFDPNATQAAIDALARVQPDVLESVKGAFRAYSDAQGVGGGGLGDVIVGLQKAFDSAMAHPSAAPPPKTMEFPPHIAAEVFGDGAQTYAPRLWNKEKISNASEYNALKKVIVDFWQNSQRRAVSLMARMSEQGGDDVRKLSEFANLSRGDLEAQAQDVLSNIMSHADGRLHIELPAGVRGSLKARTFRIPDALVEPWLERNAAVMLRHYTRTVVPETEIVRMFGDLEMTDALKKVADEADAKAAADPKKHAGIMKQKERDLKLLTRMRDRIRGTYGIPADPTSWQPRAAATAKDYLYFSNLGGMTIGAFTDTMRPMMVHGVTDVFADGWAPLVKNLSAVKASREELMSMGTALDMVRGGNAMAIADVLDNYGRHSKFERGTKWLADQFGYLTGMNWWNSRGKTVAGMVTMSSIIRAAQAEVAGKATETQIKALRASSISEEMATTIAEQFEKHGTVMDGVYLSNRSEWDKTPRARKASEAFAAAVVRDVDRIIITPGQEKPFWMSTWAGSLIGQFKSFNFSTMEKTILAGLQQRDAGVLVGAMGMLALGAGVEAIRNVINDKPQPKTNAQWAAAAFDRSGLGGVLMDVNHFSEMMTGGAVGVSALTGKRVSRYAARNIADAVLGPTAGRVKDLASVTSGVSGAIFQGDRMNETDIRAFRRSLPLQNLFYLSWLFQQMEKSTAQALNAKPEQTRH